MTNETLARLRRYALARSLFPKTELLGAVQRLGFVQADPIRAPARAQDLSLHQRVLGYRAGDLERRYAALAIEEDFFVNYGFLPHVQYRLMHPRTGQQAWDPTQRKRARAVLAFVRSQGSVHPREVEARFAHGRVVNYWGGSSNATTQLLDALHYRGLLRIARRERGVRVYAASERAPRVHDKALMRARVDALVDLALQTYAPLPAASLTSLIARLRYAVPQWRADLKPALARAKQRLASAHSEGVEWFWPAAESLEDTWSEQPAQVRLLAPFDPVVWDRRRFELFWGWAYRFEAYTPVAKRKLGYYALPVLWGEQVIGWANLTWRAQSLDCQLGFVKSRPKQRAFARELEAELERMRLFLATDLGAADSAAD